MTEPNVSSSKTCCQSCQVRFSSLHVHHFPAGFRHHKGIGFDAVAPQGVKDTSIADVVPRPSRSNARRHSVVVNGDVLGAIPIALAVVLVETDRIRLWCATLVIMGVSVNLGIVRTKDVDPVPVVVSHAVVPDQGPKSDPMKDPDLCCFTARFPSITTSIL